MSSITIASPALSGGTVTLEISAEAEARVKLTENRKSFNSVTRIKLIYAAAITQAMLIPATGPTDPAGNVEDAVQDLLASLNDVVALMEASTDF